MYAYDWFFRALAFAGKGEKDEARKWFDKAVVWTRENAGEDRELCTLWSEAAGVLDRPGPEAGP